MNFTYDVFISFADEDKAFAVELCESLCAQGIKAWCSATEVGVAENIYGKVRQGLAQSKYFLLVISEHYGRDWHRLELDNAAHVRPPEWVIPVMHGVDYDYVKSRDTFSLVAALRMVDTYNKPIALLAEEIKQKIVETNLDKGIKPPKKNHLRSFFRNRIVQMGIAAVLLVGVFIATFLLKNQMEEKIAFWKNVDKITQYQPKEIVREDPAIAGIAIDFQDKDRKKLKIVNVVVDGKNKCTEAKFGEGLQTLIFKLKNETSKPNLVIKAIIVEVRRNNEVTFDQRTAELFIDKSRDDCDFRYGILALDLKVAEGNVQLKYSPLRGIPIECKQNEVTMIPIMPYLTNKKNIITPPDKAELSFIFITDEADIRVRSRECDFSEGKCECGDE